MGTNLYTMRKLTFFLLLAIMIGACSKTDFNEIMRKQATQQSSLDSLKNRVALLEAAVTGINTDIGSLKAIATALQQKISVVSYTATSTGYLLSMSDGSSIDLKNGLNGKDGKDGVNGKDGINAPVIGVKQDTDGQYYWTLGGQFVLQNGQKLRVTGNDGAAGQSGVTPLLQVNSAANQWMISYDGGTNWQVVKDANGNPVAATGATGPQGNQGDPGPQGPAGISGFSITDNGDGIIIITYMGASYIIATATIPKVAAGSYHSLFLTKDGRLYATGYNNKGQLGLGNNTDQNKPQFVMDGVKDIAAGGNHSLILKTDGTVWGAGNNASGQLGLGDNNDRNSFTQVTDASGALVNNVAAISSGGSHNLILKTDGTVWATGNNGDGMLGIGNNTSQTRFTQAPGITAVAIGGGGNYSRILKTDGTVWATGWNPYGQLGLEDNNNRNRFTQAPRINAMAIGSGTNSTHGFIIKTGGTVWSAGWNPNGQLGLGDMINRNVFTQAIDVTGAFVTNAAAVVGGGWHSLLFKTDGTVWGAGNNGDGQLGISNTADQTRFTQAADITGAAAITAGAIHSLVIKTDGTVWAAGRNRNGQLGLGDNSDRNVFMQVVF